MPGTRYPEAEKAKVIEAALQSISTGQSLRAFCIVNKLPYVTVWGWLNPEGLVDHSAYARARDIGTHYMADECLEIADELAVKRLPLDAALEGDNGDTLQAKVAAAKLRIDTRLRLAGKWNRKDYGEKQDIDLSSKDGSMTPKPSVIEFISPVGDDKSDD